MRRTSDAGGPSMPYALSTPRLPYADLNLRCNPFGELSVEDRSAVAVVGVESLVSEFRESGIVVQFVGDRGFGKTTHLLAILKELPEAVYVHIPEGERVPVPVASTLLVDEAQRLTRWQQFRLFRSSCRLILGTHRDFSTELRRAGRVVRTIDVGEQTNVDRLRQLLNARVQQVRRTRDPIPTVSRRTAAELLRRYGPNVRAILGELYLRLERLQGIEPM